MKIRFAHLRDQGIDFAVFDADVTSRRDSDRVELLRQLTSRARYQGLKIDKSALAFQSCGQIRFFGTTDLVHYLSRIGISSWTHSMEV